MFVCWFPVESARIIQFSRCRDKHAVRVSAMKTTPSEALPSLVDNTRTGTNIHLESNWKTYTLTHTREMHKAVGSSELGFIEYEQLQNSQRSGDTLRVCTGEKRKSALHSIGVQKCVSYVYRKFSWAWDSGRYRHKSSKARVCFIQTSFINVNISNPFSTA